MINKTHKISSKAYLHNQTHEPGPLLSPPIDAFQLLTNDHVVERFQL